MLDIFRKRKRRPVYRCQLHLELLEDRAVPATIAITGAGRFQDGAVTSLTFLGGDRYAATNLRSAIVGADNMAGPDTIVLENGTYSMGGILGQFVVSDPSGSLTIQNGSGGMSTIDAQGLSRVFLNQSTLNLSGLKIQNGLASDRGGAIFNNGTLNVINCQFVNNTAQGGADGSPVQGGAIFNYANRVLNVLNSTFAGNVARGGTSSALLGGTADASGGAVFLAGSLVPVNDTIVGSTFVNNQAIGGNAALYFGFGSRGGYGAGGGVFAEAGNENLNVLDSTFAGNVAQGGRGTKADGGNGAGGGLYLQNGGAANFRLANDTIATNKAVGGAGGGALAANGVASGGGIAANFIATPAPKLINTIIANNTASLHRDVDGVFSSLGSNLIGDVTGADASFGRATGDYVGTSTAPLDPGLDPLGSYGGPTQTFRLRAGSLAIDRGNSSVVAAPLNLTNDQRGQPRRSGSAVDIGAYEVVQVDQNKSYAMAQGGTLVTAPANGLLAGYNNPLNRTVQVRLVQGTGPAVGTLTLSANGTFTYKRPAAFYGNVSFRYQILQDGVVTDLFTVTISVTKTSGRLTL